MGERVGELEKDVVPLSDACPAERRHSDNRLKRKKNANIGSKN